MEEERFNWRKTFGGGKHLEEENIWRRKTFEEENIWGRKDLIGQPSIGGGWESIRGGKI